jgi:hypothetical protein
LLITSSSGAVESDSVANWYMHHGPVRGERGIAGRADQLGEAEGVGHDQRPPRAGVD